MRGVKSELGKIFRVGKRDALNPPRNFLPLVYDKGMQTSNSHPTWHGILIRLDSMVWDEELTAILLDDEPPIRDTSKMSVVALRAVIQGLEMKRAEDVPLREALQYVLEEHKQSHLTALLLGGNPEKEIDLAHQFITRFLDRSLQEMKPAEKDI